MGSTSLLQADSKGASPMYSFHSLPVRFLLTVAHACCIKSSLRHTSVLSPPSAAPVTRYLESGLKATIEALLAYVERKYSLPRATSHTRAVRSVLLVAR